MQKKADELLNNTVLMLGGDEWRIVEIEFYEAKDPYTHGSAEQHNTGTWYFHRHKNGTFKSGTYKGLDITNGAKDAPAGILIRSIWDVKNDVVIEGPCRVVDKILAETKSDIKSLDSQKVDDAKQPIYLVGKSVPKMDIWAGPRIGLSDKYPDWRDRAYRFVSLPKAVKKQNKSLKKLGASEDTPN